MISQHGTPGAECTSELTKLAAGMDKAHQLFSELASNMSEKHNLLMAQGHRSSRWGPVPGPPPTLHRCLYVICLAVLAQPISAASYCMSSPPPMSSPSAAATPSLPLPPASAPTSAPRRLGCDVNNLRDIIAHQRQLRQASVPAAAYVEPQNSSDDDDENEPLSKRVKRTSAPSRHVVKRIPGNAGSMQVVSVSATQVSTTRQPATPPIVQMAKLAQSPVQLARLPQRRDTSTNSVTQKTPTAYGTIKRVPAAGLITQFAEKKPNEFVLVSAFLIRHSSVLRTMCAKSTVPNSVLMLRRPGRRSVQVRVRRLVMMLCSSTRICSFPPSC